MKRVTLLSILSVISITTASAQVTITKDNFPRMAGFLDSMRIVANADIPYPTGGENITWDFGSLPFGQYVAVTYFDATNDPDFPDALNSVSSPIDFTIGAFNFEASSNLFEAIDAEGWHRTGRSVSQVSVPLTALTGNPSDKLTYLAGNLDYDGRANLLAFPMTYGNQWSGSYRFKLPFELNLAAYGLNQTPGYNLITYSHTREVIGHGKLIIPTADGSPSAPMDVLMIKGSSMEVDSIFLGGSPAPLSLLNAFGIQQGKIIRDSFYNFYSPGFGSGVAIFDRLEAGKVGQITYRPQAADISSAVKQAQIPPTLSSPNPVAAGSTLTVSMSQPLSSGNIHFYNLQGQQVYAAPFSNVSDRLLQVKMPDDIPGGLLLYQVMDERHLLVGIGKVQVF